ncbi:MAG TPA: hypothetical protein VGW33_05090 [Terriglobia bacterium]|nr:hypothetical protein [Terriglobia bacterium]
MPIVAASRLGAFISTPTAVRRLALRGALGFAVGALAGLAVLLLFEDGWIGLPLGMATTGAVGPLMFLRWIPEGLPRLKAVLGFAFGFIFSSFFLIVCMFAVWGRTLFALPLIVLLSGAGFWLGGYIGGWSIEDRFARRSGRAFAIGGFVGGPFLVFALYGLAETPATSTIFTPWLLLSIPAGLIPFVLGGALFGAALARARAPSPTV